MNPYFYTLLALTLLVLLSLVLSGEVGRRKGAAGLPPGDVPPGGYDNPLYRLHRCHQNGLEVLTPFGFSVFAAMMAGVSPALLAAFAGAFVALRLVFVWLYLAGIGKASGGLRTGVFIAHTMVNLGLIALLLWQAAGL